MQDQSIQFPVTLTDSATRKALELQTENPEWAGKPMRVYLAGKGCDGFNYGVTFDDAVPADLRLDTGNLSVVVDPDSVPFVEGATIDWVDDERGKGFLVTNPNHSKFKGKFFKRPQWRERLEEKRK